MTFQYKTERDGVIETRVERKVTVTSDGDDDLDHDAVSVNFFYCVSENFQIHHPQIKSPEKKMCIYIVMILEMV